MSPPPFVLVHGAFHSGAVWEKVAALLRSRGHPVVIIDLPGRPANPLPVEQVTLQAHRNCVLAALDAIPRPVVLVGHSFGGITISAVAEEAPEKIKTLIYVAAYLPQSGQSARKLSMDDSASRWSDTNFVIAPDARTATVLPDECVMLFGEDLSPEDRQRLPSLLVPEPLLPVRTPVILKPDRFGRADKVYIRTLRDNAISPALQNAMLERTPVRAALTIDTSHSPYLSQPEALTERLLTAAAP